VVTADSKSIFDRDFQTLSCGCKPSVLRQRSNTREPRNGEDGRFDFSACCDGR
jgi:hypothetical protein